MCCAIDRPNPSGGYSADGLAADKCLPNGLCQQSWTPDENITMRTEYYREECTVKGWKNGSCLSVCLSNSASSNVLMTPCDDTANSTRWCCGTNKDCCAGDIGVEILAQTFLGMVATSTSALSSSATATASGSTSAPTPTSSSSTVARNSGASSSLSGGATAGIIIGALAGIMLVGAAWFFIARRRRPAGPPPPVYAEKGQRADDPKTYYAHEADGSGPQVSEISAANVKDHDGRTGVHEMQ
ncbi:hypothetical protein BU25DRAFT_486881 [Macroventuria anomochaeta]|uniref:Uncharacterized protein n=1 Tax=Macroventuria anomochaeta TaxID=301207 RepID=A0ACB6SHX6_9PLEO|nr:uncharacterized protein BU25DRAFT_486881 [Macroventuria anomochaeta]KAF2633885.1 hypothetical protein BU25DRAFT_486881 [Macroventuria anomochaeta]